MKQYFCLSLLSLSFALTSIVSPAAAMSTAPVVDSSHAVRTLDIGSVTSQDTIEYDDTANI